VSAWSIRDEREAIKELVIAAETSAGTRVETEESEPTYTDFRDALEALPLVCVYTPEDVGESAGNSTSWATKLKIVIDCWTYGQKSETQSAAEVAGQARDELVGQVLAATTGNSEWIKRFEAVTKVTVKRGISNLGSLTYGAASIVIDAETTLDHGLAADTSGDPFRRSAVDMSKDAVDEPRLTVDIEVPNSTPEEEAAP